MHNSSGKCNGSPVGLNQNSRAIAQDFGDTVANFRRIVAHANDGVGTQFSAMRQHLLKGIIPRPLAKAGIERNVPAENALDGRADVPNNGSRANNNSTYNAKRFDNPIAG